MGFHPKIETSDEIIVEFIVPHRFEKIALETEIKQTQSGEERQDWHFATSPRGRRALRGWQCQTGRFDHKRI